MLTKIILDGQFKITEELIKSIRDSGLLVGGWLSKQNYSLLKVFNSQNHVFFKKPIFEDNRTTLIESNIRESDGILFFPEDEADNEIELFQQLSLKHDVSFAWCDLSSGLDEDLEDISAWLKEQNIETLYFKIQTNCDFNNKQLNLFFSNLMQIGNDQTSVKETKYSYRNGLTLRLNQFMVAFLICILLLCCKSFEIQVINNEELSKKATQSQTSVRKFKTRRAGIVDRNDVAIASSLDCMSISVDPMQIRYPKIVSKILSDQLDLDRKKIEKSIVESDKRYLLVKRGVSLKTANIIKERNLKGQGPYTLISF